jgi:tripartite-type tricarboxylate transporter receptor subunit TctC
MFSVPEVLRRAGAFCALLAAAASALSAPAQFPSGPVTIVVPFPPGGATDYVARQVGQALATTWKVPVIVDNKAGAAGNIAAEAVARSAPDGHTLMLGAVSLVTNPALYKIPVFVPRVLTPLGVGVESQLVTIARVALPANDYRSLLSLAASKPGVLNGASAGSGTLSHLGLEELQAQHKLSIGHVPYKGSAPALNDIVGGQVDLMIDTVASAGPLIAAGKVKALAVHTRRRTAALPEVPTTDELGVRGMTFGAWNLFVVPSATPPERIALLNSALAKVMREPSVSRALNDRGLDIIAQRPAESLQFMLTEAGRWEKLIKAKGIAP